MTVEEQLVAIEKLKALGALKVKVGDVEVEFSTPDSQSQNVEEIAEAAFAAAKKEFFDYLTDEEKATVESRMKDKELYG